jgi:uncharacterized protein YjdB
MSDSERGSRLGALTIPGRLGFVMAVLCGAVLLAPPPAVAQRPPAIASVQVSPGEGQVNVGRAFTFYATAYDAANNAIPTVTDFEWTSSNPRAATVDKYGVATGVGAGVAIITARVGRGTRAKAGHATLQIVAPGATVQPQSAAQPAAAVGTRGAEAAVARATGPGCVAQERQPEGSGAPAGLVVNPLHLVLVKGESQPLQYRAVRGDGSNAEKVCIQFTVDPGGERIAQVDSFGLVTSVGDTGRVMLRATVPGQSAWPPKQIAVDVHADSVEFGERELSLAPGTQDTLVLVVPAEDNRVLSAAGMFQFTSSDTTKVKVSPVAPIVTAVAPGSARITAVSCMYPDIHAVVSVHRPIARLIGTPLDTLVTLAIGSTVRLEVRFLAADSTPVADVPVQWTSPDTTVAQFDTATETLRGVSMGDTQITVQARSDRNHVIFRHWHVRVVAGGLAIATPRMALGIGQRTSLAVQLLDDHGQPVGPASDLTWTSSDTAVAQVADGAVVGVGMGHARLVARAPWDSTVTADAYVMGDLIVTGLKAGHWNLYMTDLGHPGAVLPLTQDTALESQPAWSPTLMRIAYIATPRPRTDQSDLYLAAPDGSGRQALTDDSAAVGSPAFVPPTGEQVVFQSSRRGKSQLYLIGADGSGRRMLTTGDVSNSQPAVSPDGRQVLFVSPREHNYDVYLMGIDGTGLRQLTNSKRAEDSPVFAADGRSFYYLRDEGGRPRTKRVYLQDLTTGAAVPVTPAGLFVQAFSVSPDGHTLALTVLNEARNGAATARIEVFDAATKTLRPLVVPGLEQLGGAAFRPPMPTPPAP